MAYENYTIDQFMSAWFNKDYSELSEDEFSIVYAEYQDTSGLFLTDDFERQSLIHHLNSRINYVKMFLRLQREFIEEFNIPFVRDFESFKNDYGYVLKWNGDIVDFENQLKKVEKRQIKHISFLEERIKEINDLRGKNKNKIKEEETEDSLKKSRVSFIRMLNSLGKIGYKLNRKTTYVEELSLMIKQQMEEVEEVNSRK